MLLSACRYTFSEPVNDQLPDLIAIQATSTATRNPNLWEVFGNTVTSTLAPSGEILTTATPNSHDLPTELPQSYACAPITDNPPGHFLLSRPIGPGGRNWVDPNYPYGSTSNDTLDPHFGVEFFNSAGTPVLAAAEGTVLVAGDDTETIFGPSYNFYGNLVIVQHDFQELSTALFTLYAHLSEISVDAGQQVEVGQEIGLVGASGIAIGSHLHFEVRLSLNSYYNTRNPEAWLQPRLYEDDQMRGIIAGSVLNSRGIWIQLPTVVAELIPEEGQDDYPTVAHETYTSTNLNSDDLWGENFLFGDLPAGRYRISFVSGTLHERMVEILPGQVTSVTFCLAD